MGLILALRKTIKQALFGLSFLLLLEGGSAAASTFCARLVPKNLNFAHDIPDLVEFTSGKTGNEILVPLLKRLGPNSTRAFLSEDQKQVIKIYPGNSIMALREILLSRFFKEFGFPVSEVVDFSLNVLQPNSQLQIVVKSFAEGRPPVVAMAPQEYIRRNVQEWGRLKTAYQNVFTRHFRGWVRSQPEHEILRSFYSEFLDKPWADLEIRNWVVHEGNWILIDP